MKKGLSGITEILFGLVFVVAGIVVIYFGINRLMKLEAGKYAETQARITHIETTTVSDEDGIHEQHDITVEYQVDGKKYVSHLGENPREFYEGMELTVLYEIEKPTEVILPGKTSSYIMIAMGAVAVICGGVVILRKVLGRSAA
jgi:hypothetical protein